MRERESGERERESIGMKEPKLSRSSVKITSLSTCYKKDSFSLGQAYE